MRMQLNWELSGGGGERMGRRGRRKRGVRGRREEKEDGSGEMRE